MTTKTIIKTYDKFLKQFSIFKFHNIQQVPLFLFNNVNEMVFKKISFLLVHKFYKT